MGICTIQSYHGSQMFEILGLDDNFVNKFFPGTTTAIGGIGLEEIVQDIIFKHKDAYGENKGQKNERIDFGGRYKYKKDGEFHLFNPNSVKLLRNSVENKDYKTYKEFTKLVDEQEINPSTL